MKSTKVKWVTIRIANKKKVFLKFHIFLPDCLFSHLSNQVIAKTTSSPYWGEQFDLRLYADQSKVLEITLCGANQSASDFIEKSCIDLSELPIEKSHSIVQKFNVDQRCIELQITITGSQQGPTTNNISSSNINCPVSRSKSYSDIRKKYVRF